MPNNTSARPAFFEALHNIRTNLLRLYRRNPWTLPHIALFPVVLVYEELLLRLFGDGKFFSTLLYPILFALAAGLFCSCLTSVFKRKANRIISLVLLYLFGLLFTVECLVRDSYQVYMTLGAIRTGAGGVVGGFAGNLLLSILHGLPKIFLFFLPALFYTLTGRRRIPARRYHLGFVGMLLILALVFSGVSVLTATHGKSALKYKTQFEFDSAVKTFGLLTGVRLNEQYNLFGNDGANFVLEDPAPTVPPAPTPVASHMDSSTDTPVVYGDNVMSLDFAALAESEDDEDIKALHQYVASQTPSRQNEYTGLFQDKNLILICAEAFSDAVISEELTPTLYRMTHNGFYFSDFYQPSWGGSTSTGEFSFLTGLVPMDGVETMLDTQHNNNYLTLGNQLQREGYWSCSYHNGDYDFYDRDKTHTNLGYDNFLGLGNGLEDITDWWPDDETMFSATMDTYMDQQPFSVYYMTISGHCTYDEDNDAVGEHLSRVQEVLGSRYKDTTMYYYCYQMELEDALTTMIQKLEETGIADDTVICMTADHYPYGLEDTETFGNSENYIPDLYGYTPKHCWERDRNALILWSGCLEHEHSGMAREISTPTYSLDVTPTLSNLFGLSYDSRLLVGRDVFSDAEPLVMWSNYSWVTECGKYDALSGEYFANAGYENDSAYVERINQIVTNKINYSTHVVNWDYFGKLFGGG